MKKLEWDSLWYPFIGVDGVDHNGAISGEFSCAFMVHLNALIFFFYVLVLIMSIRNGPFDLRGTIVFFFFASDT